MDMRTIVKKNPIIAATELDRLGEAIESPACAILLMYSKLTRLMEEEQRIRDSSKPIFLHTDLMNGLSNDKEAFRFLSTYIKPTGIVTTKGPMIRAAKKEGMLTIQRVFLIDTTSLTSTIKNVLENQPDAIEIMPGIAPSIVPVFKEQLKQPIILGGLIWNQEQVLQALEYGADAVSLSRPELWNHIDQGS
ncbi:MULTISPECIES: glycerol-3-phosphate responsive antiterminator [Brevibacillus]|uniref:Glycerol uptake operon antiterminator regulatory protein n=1 Tax=Brevibacillus invocatus TaxID=173959 RepID=A0A3M8CFK6_9BACL|nr:MULTISPECIES: glycerol-3-phosphate responsive antiterminator [Brevibacillus]MDH4616333.1 glycerol-3-phosphate responsive antiterminator [Brevibacillus sp. AY1]RNB74532.1 glycerol-3-phosphate responsive antiterminator [Brevibacillus invocatus]